MQIVLQLCQSPGELGLVFGVSAEEARQLCFLGELPPRRYLSKAIPWAHFKTVCLWRAGTGEPQAFTAEKAVALVGRSGAAATGKLWTVTVYEITQ